MSSWSTRASASASRRAGRTRSEDVRRKRRQALCDSRRRLGPQARRPRLRRLRRGGARAGGGARLPLRLHLRLLGHRQHAGRHGGRLRRRRPRRPRHRHRRLGQAGGDAARRSCASRRTPPTWSSSAGRSPTADVVLDTRYAYPEYGLPSAETLDAIRLCGAAGRHDDRPGLRGEIDAGHDRHDPPEEIPAGSKVLYAHLGGVPAINGYSYLFRNG